MRKAGLALALAAWLAPAAAQQLTAEDRMKSCDPKVAIAAAKEVLADPAQLKEPLMLFPAAMVLYQNGQKDDAVFWFYAAQLRTRYQLVFEGGDRGQLLMVMMMSAAPINNYAFLDIGRFNRTLDRVLAWDRKTPNPFRDRVQTPEERKTVEGIYAGIGELRKKLAAEKDQIQAQAREAAADMQAMMGFEASRCAPGKPDPAYDRVTIAEEWRKVLEAAKVHPNVVKEVGAVKSAYPDSSETTRDGSLPARYIASVQGAERTVYAVFKATRSAKEAHLDFECVTRRSSGQRESSKDVCAQ